MNGIIKTITLFVNPSWFDVKYAGHQQWIGSPTYCVVDTTTVKMMKKMTVNR